MSRIIYRPSTHAVFWIAAATDVITIADTGTAVSPAAGSPSVIGDAKAPDVAVLDGVTPPAGYPAEALVCDGVSVSVRAGYAPPPAPKPPLRWQVMKLTVRRRLRAQGKEAAYDSALAALTGSQAADFKDAVAVNNDDAQAIALLTNIGADVTATLAPDPNAGWFAT